MKSQELSTVKSTKKIPRFDWDDLDDHSRISKAILNEQEGRIKLGVLVRVGICTQKGKDVIVKDKLVTEWILIDAFALPLFNRYVRFNTEKSGDGKVKALQAIINRDNKFIRVKPTCKTKATANTSANIFILGRKSLNRRKTSEFKFTLDENKCHLDYRRRVFKGGFKKICTPLYLYDNLRETVSTSEDFTRKKSLTDIEYCLNNTTSNESLMGDLPKNIAKKKKPAPKKHAVAKKKEDKKATPHKHKEKSIEKKTKKKSLGKADINCWYRGVPMTVDLKLTLITSPLEDIKDFYPVFGKCLSLIALRDLTRDEYEDQPNCIDINGYNLSSDEFKELLAQAYK